MTIHEIEKKVGITKANIRFYEREGLISPGRGLNNYREYEEKDAVLLSRVKFLRLIGVSLSDIKQLISGQKPLNRLLADRQAEIAYEIENLYLSQNICDEILKREDSFQTLDPEQYLNNSSNFKGGDVILKQDKNSKTRIMETWMCHFTQGLVMTLPLMIVVPKALNISIPVWVTVFYLILTLGATAAYALLRNLPD